MSSRAMEGTCLAALVRMAIPLCRAAERECPRIGPGSPPYYPVWKMAVFIVVAVAKRRKSKSAQYRFLHQHRAELMEWLDLKEFPARSTFFARYRQAHRLFKEAIRLQGQKAIQEGVANPRTVAVDKSLVPARGPQWNQKDRQANRIPKRGIDRDARWGHSQHDGWIYGYSYEVVVTATEGSTVFPLQASADTASASEHATFGDKIKHLPKQTKDVTADRGYDNVNFADAIERDRGGRRTGRRFACPPARRGRTPRNSKKRSREPVDPRRRRRLKFCRSRAGKRLMAQRSKTVEPFNQWFKNLFDLDDRVWHRGLGNNQTQLLAAVFCYQLLVRYNRQRGRVNGEVRWILDSL